MKDNMPGLTAADLALIVYALCRLTNDLADIANTKAHASNGCAAAVTSRDAPT
jgi:hypothetical protein